MRLKKMIISYFALHTNRSEDQVSEDLERDYFMSAEEGVEYGLVDNVLVRGENEQDQE